MGTGLQAAPQSHQGAPDAISGRKTTPLNETIAKNSGQVEVHVVTLLICLMQCITCTLIKIFIISIISELFVGEG